MEHNVRGGGGAQMDEEIPNNIPSLVFPGNSPLRVSSNYYSVLFRLSESND